MQLDYKIFTCFYLSLNKGFKNFKESFYHELRYATYANNNSVCYMVWYKGTQIWENLRFLDNDVGHFNNFKINTSITMFMDSSLQDFSWDFFSQPIWVFLLSLPDSN